MAIAAGQSPVRAGSSVTIMSEKKIFSAIVFTLFFVAISSADEQVRLPYGATLHTPSL